MLTQTEALIAALIESGVVAILRTESADPIVDITDALVSGGVCAIEVTLTTPNALRGIEAVADRFGDRVLLGVGSVLTPAQCRDARVAGARYVISPHLDDAVVETTKSLEMVSIPGAFTPTEMLRATLLGADLVKVFPAAAVGPGYVRDILAPLPHLKLMPTGGVAADNIGQWMSAGAVCAGVGSSIVPKASVACRDWNAITRLAKAFRVAVTAARST